MSSDLRSKHSITSGNRFLTKKSILSVESVAAIESLSTISCKSNGSIDLGSSDTSLGYPVPITECSVNCCGTTIGNASVQLTGIFKTYKSCIRKLSCSSHHTGSLCVVYVSLLENDILHLQTETDNNEFFHRPIHLSSMAPQDVYSFSDSVHHMRYCIVIRPSPKETYHLMTCSRVQRDTWLIRLKRGCSQPVALPRKVQCLTIQIGEGRKIQTKDSFLYCDVAVDHEIRGLTGSLRRMSNLFWRENFKFTDIPQVSHGLTVNLYSKNCKNDRDTIYGHVFIPVDQLNSSQGIQEEWYEVRKDTNKHRTFASLAGLGSGSTSLGELRISILLEEHQVFSLSTYQPLINVLKGFHHELIYDMARKTSDMQALARNLLRIYEGMGLTLTWIKSLIDYEVDSLTLDDANILFRGNSFFTKVIDSYMKMSGREFLEEALQFTIEKICKSGLYIEVETSRLPGTPEEEINENCRELFKHVRTIWSEIQRAKTKCPIEFRRMFGHLKSAIVKKFDLEKDTLERHHQVARYTCVSGFIFLRWICPAIISPKQFDLVQDHPDANTCRTLTLIAKCLMTLASHSTTEQNTKEVWINQLNAFIHINTNKFTDFINYVSIIVEEQDNEELPKGEDTTANYFIDLPYELAQLSRWCTEECTVNNVITKTCHSIMKKPRMN
ncbi:hypothetical protein G6F62_002626 [Rhizopus arrhizus]|nr:hypothetical protein G6F62_002626 [Rhizopus arrhizus]